MSIYIIAEADVNHNDSIELAKKLVDMVVDCGTDVDKPRSLAKSVTVE